jgi:hypothetical protein
MSAVPRPSKPRYASIQPPSFPCASKARSWIPVAKGTLLQELHYGEAQPQGPFHRLLRKGTTFRLEYVLQPDKFGNQSNSYWISVDQHWSRPFQQNADGVVYSNRMIKLARNIPGPRLIQDSQTTAREFGAESVTRFETADKERE